VFFWACLALTLQHRAASSQYTKMAAFSQEWVFPGTPTVSAGCQIFFSFTSSLSYSVPHTTTSVCYSLEEPLNPGDAANSGEEWGREEGNWHGWRGYSDTTLRELKKALFNGSKALSFTTPPRANFWPPILDGSVICREHVYARGRG